MRLTPTELSPSVLCRKDEPLMMGMSESRERETEGNHSGNANTKRTGGDPSTVNPSTVNPSNISPSTFNPAPLTRRLCQA